MLIGTELGLSMDIPSGAENPHGAHTRGDSSLWATDGGPELVCDPSTFWDIEGRLL